MSQRHISRQIALQTLYELDVKDTLILDREELGGVLNYNIEELSPDHKDKDYLYGLVNLVLSRLETLNDIIVKAAPEWPLDKISYMDRNVLRIGLAELLFADREQVPPKVAIDQAIELAKAFGNETSGKFINGVLGKVYKELGEPDKDSVSKKRAVIEQLTGVILYTRHEGDIYVGLVHDLFKHWTICKSHTLESESEEEGVKRVVSKEFGLSDAQMVSHIGDGEYIANHPEKGKIVKHVRYYLATHVYEKPKAEEGGGLDDAKWIKINELGSYKIYKEIQSTLAKAVAQIP